MDIVDGYTPMNPTCNVTLKDNLTLYYKKTSAIAALLWYNVTQGADAQWRKRWFHHLLGSESSVMLSRSLFDKEDALVHLLVVRNMKTNKKKYVLCYPNDTNDLVTGIEQTSTEMKCKCHVLLKLLFGLSIALPLYPILVHPCDSFVSLF
jgi:hypothetical protein